MGYISWRRDSRLDEVTLTKTGKRRAKRPRFVRIESWRYKRLDSSWRVPRGKDSKTRKSRKGWPLKPSIGYRASSRLRDVHPSGKREVAVVNLKELEALKGVDVVARISRRVGRRKRREITDKAKELGVALLNPLRERALEAEAGTAGGQG
jgi:large subunit ribosomal protein L32e